MGLKEIIEGKKEWKAHITRVKTLPKDYQIVYSEIQKYLYKVGPVELVEGISLLINIVDLFEEGVKEGKEVLEVTGKDVAQFCDNLIEGSEFYSDRYEVEIQKEVNKAVKKSLNK